MGICLYLYLPISKFSTGQAHANSIMFNQLFTSDTFDLSLYTYPYQNSVQVKHTPIVSCLTSCSRQIPSTCRKNPAKRYRSRQNTFDLSQKPRKTLQVVTEYLRPVTKTPRNVTGRDKTPSTCRKNPAKRYRSRRNTPDLSRNRRETLPVAAESERRKLYCARNNPEARNYP